MMVGDHNQSIYGFSYLQSKVLCRLSRATFRPLKFDLDENFRSSKVVVDIAAGVGGDILGERSTPHQRPRSTVVGDDEEGEAKLVADEIQRLCKEGHPDIEGPITARELRCAWATRYTLLPSKTS